MAQQGFGSLLQGLFQPPQQPMAQEPGALTNPMQGMGAVERYKYLNNNNPEALLGLASGLLRGDLGAGFAAAGDQLAAGRQQFLRRQDELAKENKTKKWLVANRGLTDEQADLALSNPAILGSYLQGEERQSLLNTGNGQIYDPNTGQWISAPGAGPVQEAPKIVELFDETTGQPYKAAWDPQGQKYERVGGVKARSGMTLKTNPDGSVELIQGDLSGLPKLNEAEGRNSGFYGRGVKSHDVLSKLEGQGTSLWNKTMTAIPGGLGNYGLAPEAQQFDQAQRDFVNAVLRRESGAVISPEEFANAKVQYLPQPGDGPEVIAQKRANRETTIRGLEISSGQGAAFATQPPTAQGGAAPGATQAQTPGSARSWRDLGSGVKIRQLD